MPRILPHKMISLLLKFDTNATSRICFGRNSSLKITDILKQEKVGSKILLIYQEGLPERFVTDIQDQFAKSSFQCHHLQLPSGEEAKSLSCLKKVWDYLQELKFERNDGIVALGGGAISDLSGFAASTYLRGINYFIVPTSLLAQIDAAIGGKTGINLEDAKNLAGTFYLPKAVIVDPNFIKTLSNRELRSGLGELVKYLYLEKTIAANTEYKPGPKPLLQIIQDFIKSESTQNNNNPISTKLFNSDLMDGLILNSIQMKAGVILKDPYEKGLRRCLNLGHTLGHTIEKYTNYDISHGESVSIGISFAAFTAMKNNLISKIDYDQVIGLNTALDLKAKLELAKDKNQDDKEILANSLINIMMQDKKRSDGLVKYVLPDNRNIAGDINYEYAISFEDLKSLLLEFLSA